MNSYFTDIKAMIKSFSRDESAAVIITIGLEQERGLPILNKVSGVISGEQSIFHSLSEDIQCTPYNYAPVTSVSVERSFLAY